MTYLVRIKHPDGEFTTRITTKSVTRAVCSAIIGGVKDGKLSAKTGAWNLQVHAMVAAQSTAERFAFAYRHAYGTLDGDAFAEDDRTVQLTGPDISERVTAVLGIFRWDGSVERVDNRIIFRS